jgi:4-hydroxybenzoate polyprenyltransferase
VYSNVYIALAGAGMAVTTLLLAGMPVTWEPVIIAFTVPMFVYNLNRFTDIEEDAVNVPHRANFIQKYGKVLFTSGILLYILGLWLAVSQNIAAFAFTLTPGAAGVIYSVLRAKKVLFAKNVIVSLSWAPFRLL